MQAYDLVKLRSTASCGIVGILPLREEPSPVSSASANRVFSFQAIF
jgi:hypothetical protein